MADAGAALPLAPYDATILDLGLPDGDGLSLLTDLRRAGSLVPLLVLAARDAVEARVTGLARVKGVRWTPIGWTGTGVT